MVRSWDRPHTGRTSWDRHGIALASACTARLTERSGSPRTSAARSPRARTRSRRRYRRSRPSCAPMPARRPAEIRVGGAESPPAAASDPDIRLLRSTESLCEDRAHPERRKRWNPPFGRSRPASHSYSSRAAMLQDCWLSLFRLRIRQRSTKTIAAASVRGRGGCRALIAGLVGSLAVLSAASRGYGVERATWGRQR